MFRKIKDDFWMLRRSGRNILVFELTYKLAATAVFYPIAILIINLVMKAAGAKYLTNEYIIRIFKNPVSWIVMLAAVVIFVFYCIYEMSFLAACFELKRQRCKASVLEIAFTSLKRMKRLINIRNLPLIFFYFISILAINVTMLGSLVLSEKTITAFRIYVINGPAIVKAGLAAAVIVVYTIVIMGVYSFNICVLEGDNFRTSYRQSASTVRKHFLPTLMSLILYNLAILAVIILFYVIITAVLFAGVKILNMAYMGSAIYLSVLKNIRIGIRILLLYLAVPISYTMISRMYYYYSDPKEIDYVVIRIKSKFFRLQRMIYFLILIMSIGLNSFYVVRTFNKNPFESIAIFHETKITAHRGSSIKAPENTMAAFELAVENMTDFIELDVQLTSDNVPVIMHDRSLYRTTGVNAKVSELTYSQIRELDAGSYFGKEFAGEKVPSLEEVLRFVKGKAQLNIELKSGDTVYTADKVTELIQKYDMQNDCVITSFDYNMLKRVKELTDDIQVGYILSIAYGDFYSMDDVDFFSMNASFLSKQIVDAIHNSGKQVYAWTVNNATSIKNLTNKGVDNIITDDPVLARETIYSRDTSETLVNMAKYVFNQ